MTNEEQNNFPLLKETQELQSNLKRIDSMRKLYEYCASGEFRQYINEVAMDKLNKDFALKQDKRAMEICKDFLEQYENGTLFKEME